MDESRTGLPPGRSLYLVDAMGLFFRSHFAFVRRPLTTSAGMPSGALFGFTNTLLALLRDEKAEYVAVALDTPGPTFRHEKFPAYKATRPEMPGELALQVPYLSRLIDTLGICSLAQEGVEADDLIASLVRKACEVGWDSVVVSADKDFGQLIGPGVRQYVPARGAEPSRWVDEGEVRARYGIAPAQFVDYLALVGDSIDNVPGVSGIGPKTAAQLLQEHGSLDAILAHAPLFEPASLRRRLEEGREAALMSRELVRLRADLPVAEPHGFRVPDPAARPAFRELLRELDFRVIEKRIFGAAAVSPALQASLLDEGEVREPEDTRRVSSAGPEPAGASALPGVSEPVSGAIGWGSEYGRLADARELASTLAGFDVGGATLALDLCSAGENPQRDDLLGLAFGWRPGRFWYLPLSVSGKGGSSIDEARRLIGPLLADPAVTKVGRGLGEAMWLLERHGMSVDGPLDDIGVAAYVRDPESPMGLRELAHQWLGHRMMEAQEGPAETSAAAAAGRGDAQGSAAQACERADVVLRLRPLMEQALKERAGWSLYHEIEMPLIPVLAAMSAAGIQVDAEVLRTMGESFAGEMRRKEGEIHHLAGGVFNINSPKQLQEVLFDRLKLARRRRTKTGYSTGQAVLEELAGQHPLPREILAYRQLAKLKNTYADALPRMIDPATGRIHARFHQTVTATGRLSSSDPNLQNIPVRSALGREIRRAFVADEGKVFLSADYSQIELRVLAHLSADETLCEAFRKGADIHRTTAARVAGIPEAEVTPDQRGRAKTINFGVIYGMGAVRLAAELGIPQREAAAFIESYFAALPGMKSYMEGCVDAARRSGYAQTLLGRRRYLPDLGADHPRQRAAAERMALNATVQGSAADLIKIAMIRMHERLRAGHPGTRMLLQVHDELLFEAPAADAAEIAREIRVQMETVMELRVPLQVHIGTGGTWLEAHG
ncbi:MAG: DNA polymerase I [Candidatus Eisenbacteria bacterium]